MNSGHYTASINCREKHFRNYTRSTDFNINYAHNSFISYILLYKLSLFDQTMEGGS